MVTGKKRRNVVIALLFVTFILVGTIPFVAAENTIAEQPGFVSKIVLKFRQILHLDDDLIKKIVEANSLENEGSAKIELSTQTTRKLFRVCERFTSLDDEEASGGQCIKRTVNIDYDDLPLYQNSGGIIAFDESNNKFLSYFQRDNYKYTEFDYITFFFCDGDKAYTYNGDYPNVLLELDVSEHQNLCSTNVLSEDKLRGDLEELKETNPRVRKKLTLNGKEVIEIYWKHGRETAFTYFDASDYKYIKSVERWKQEPYDTLVDDYGPVSFMEFRQNVYTKSANLDVSDVEFELWDGGEQDVPNFRDMKKCPVDVEPMMLGPKGQTNPQYTTPIQYNDVLIYNPADAGVIDQLRELGDEFGKKELDVVNGRQGAEGITEAEWNEYESLRISLPWAKCSGEKPFSFEDYNILFKPKEVSNGDSSYFGNAYSKPEILKQLNRNRIDQEEILQK